ncbi:MAG: hypothetical protein J0L70_23750 [Leptolyngbya sp. UWPOB_LEPTO1]|uniref:hypothetical protein n=1 Tax=Leptolyngbya sp. UWPOB_LEPTO1 TaxID=2815653 RepID=UPI001AD5277B|nr:hypothetical protein [Leptolyngbya sp. UWPOB_LEPTO1]MBN8563558.1 hypothetical protein [Leptolyngbya sp. UWPOB_LEPTO1]
MFLFNDPKEVSDIELVHDRALPTETSVGIPLAATVFLGVGGFILSANPVVGGALAAVPAYGMFKRFQNNWRNNAFERRNAGCVAHLIKTDADMILWIEHHGVDEVRSQLLTALKHRQKLTSCAKRTLRALVPESELPAKRVEQFLSAQSPALPESVPEGVRMTTQLGEPSAINVPAQTVEGAPIPKSITEHYLSDLRSTFLCAPPRTGKGILAAQLMQGFKSRFPNGKLLTCTIKQFAGENWYWSYSDAHLNPETRTPDQQLAAARDIFNLINFWESQRSTADAPCLLVIDEIRDTLNLLGSIPMNAVSSDYAESKKTFGEWMLGVAISSATLNQCHHRFMLIISPVVSLAGLGGIKGVSKDALGSFVGITLAAPKAMQFATGDNGTFSAPKIDSNDPRFLNCHALAYCKNDKQWYPIESLPKSAIDKLANSNPTLKKWNSVSLNPRVHLEKSWTVESNFEHEPVAVASEDKTESTEQEIRAEIKRFLLANSEGSKPRDLSARARKPVKGMSTDDIKLYLDVMAIDGEIYEVNGTFFANS